MEEACSSHHALFQQLERAEAQALHIQGEKEAHDIFLSHSGKEKDFVKKLDRALRKASYDPFFDIRSIPPGEIFPPHILHNARECKLGVVVLSPGFLTSKWPMLELCTMLTSPRNPRPIVLPLFFHIQPHDLKLVSPMWRDAWKKFQENDPSRVNIREWESAAIQLSKIQGEVYQAHMGEDQFIEAVLLRIYNIIRPPLRYDILHLTGHERLTRDVAQKFEELPATITSQGTARTIGFFAIGGQGKTTICKLMMNHYASAYAGRCALIEFPSNDCNEKEVLRQCNKALQQLTNSNIHHIDDFDQCLQQMKKRIGKLNVFIAIDNVWESSLDFAQRILDDVEFSGGSKILVTGRSQRVLLNLLKDASYVKPLPGVNEEEAHQMFVKSFNRNQAGLGVLLEDANVHDVTKWLRYDGGYHPLTVNAVGVTLGRTGGHNWHAVWKHQRSNITGSGSIVDKSIKINFNSIPEPRRDMFLDVALICIPILEQGLAILEHELTIHNYNDMAHILLSAIYKGEMDKDEISMTLMQLAYDGLLEFEDSKFHVHDLYKELAAREAAARSPRYILVNKGDLPVDNWAEGERIAGWSRHAAAYMPAYVRGLELPKLRVLFIRNATDVWGPIYMPQLRVLILYLDRGSEYNMDLKDMPELMWLELRGLSGTSCNRLNGISRLTNLSVLILDAVARYEDEDEDLNELCLDGLVNLQILRIDIQSLQKISGLGSLINLKYCRLTNIGSLQKISYEDEDAVARYEDQDEDEDLNELCLDGLVNLQSLTIENIGRMQKISGLGSLINLQECYLRSRPVLRKLQTLVINGPNIEFSFSLPKIRNLQIERITWKQLRFSKFEGLTNLTFILINNCHSLVGIEWSSLNDLTNLTHLVIHSCSKLEEIRGEPKGVNQTLRSLGIINCERLKKVSRLHFLTNCDFRFHLLPRNVQFE